MVKTVNDMEDVEAYVYRQLAEHLRRNPIIQNIDMMNVFGFCRNCLAKWYFAGCVKYGVKGSYDDCLRVVYGMEYSEWKTRYQGPATSEQLEKFKKMANIHAIHQEIHQVEGSSVSMEDYFPKTKIQAFVFQKVVEHFQKNVTIQNIDVMNTAGFCRNCLSKWYFNGAKISGHSTTYDEACIRIYSMPYDEWKVRYQTAASKEQLDLFEKSKGFRAHTTSGAPSKPKPAIVKSDVCCQAVDSCAESMIDNIKMPPSTSSSSPTKVHLGILTVSDRAHSKIYKDESGPEIRECVELYAKKSGAIYLENIRYQIVPDEREMISAALISLSESCNLIFTTGGTGLSQRDITPEATLDVIQREVRGIPEAMRRETSKIEPFAVLSRSVAGIRNNDTLIINLPGRPKACRECLAVCLPVLPHAVTELTKESM